MSSSGPTIMGMGIGSPVISTLPRSSSSIPSPSGSITPPSILPANLIKRILGLEFINMAELIPDTWRYLEEDTLKCCHHGKRQQRDPVTDMLLWVECYSSVVAVLATGFHAHRTFAGEGWVTYDSAYRRRASLTKSLDRGQVDFNLHNETFAGRGRVLSRCKHCSSEHHSSTRLCLCT